MLSTAGHIQSLINPPASSKRKFYTNPDTPTSAEQWRQGAEEHAGSWWPYWVAWLKALHDGDIESPTEFGNPGHPEIVPAPGTYVLE